MGTESIAPPLSATDTKSFAYYTINKRLPVTLAQIVDGLFRNRQKITDKYGQECAEDIKELTGRLSELRYQLQTDKLLADLKSDAPDIKTWNMELARLKEAGGGVSPTWYSTTWLFAECYMYRALQEYVALTKRLQSYDVFGDQKRKAYTDSVEPIRSLLTYLTEVTSRLQIDGGDQLPDLFSQFVQIALWGNKCDLSISQGAENSQKECVLEQLSHLKPHILIDDTNEVLAALRCAAASRDGGGGRVDIVLDNAGFELVTDLCLAEVLLAAGLASTIHFHGKALPWFVSDVTQHDFSWTLDTMSSSDDLCIAQMASRWKNRLQDGSWNFSAHSFWTLPFSFCHMKEQAMDLCADLSKADCVFFKGDLNYRKLTGDRAWDPTTPFSASLQGFRPAPLCALRTMKSDTVTGLRTGQAEEMGSIDQLWQVSGNWAVISFCGKSES